MLTDVHSIPTTASLFDTMQCMIEHKTSVLPVLDVEGHAAAYIVDDDILRYLTGKDSETTTPTPSMYPLWHRRDSLDTKFSEMAKVNVMGFANPKVIAIDIYDESDKLFYTLSDAHIRKVSVVDVVVVVGAVSGSDLMHQLLEKVF